MRVHPSEPADAELVGTCPVCHQPECPDSVGGSRPKPASHSPRLKPGERDYRGYGDWLVHPDEARFVLHRGYAIVDGIRQPVMFTHNEAFGAQIHVEGTATETSRKPGEGFVDSALTATMRVREDAA